jgi:hypothetical protein
MSSFTLCFQFLIEDASKSSLLIIYFIYLSGILRIDLEYKRLEIAMYHE